MTKSKFLPVSIKRSSMAQVFWNNRGLSSQPPFKIYNMKLLRWFFSSLAYISIRMYRGVDSLPVRVRLYGVSHADLVIAMASAMETSNELESIVIEAVKLLQDERKAGTHIVKDPPGRPPR
jgi:hypothetical protein